MDDRGAEAATTSKGHGRLERREIRTSDELVGYSNFPGLAQVAEVKKRVLVTRSGEIKESIHYLVTSLPEHAAKPHRLLAHHRGHWGIENSLFHVKDDSFGEDRAVLASHHSGTVMSLLRAAAMNILRGQSHLWADAEPLTGRAQAVSVNAKAILSQL
ncbi:MAG TPA: hypothetical protein VF960_02430 [Chloroflexota bacterium]